ncbi:MAG: cobyrinate a,c-diamide synthase, partial [Prevotella sp.]|nr:cobyrinate a,c-diamide synthase [Prevotella sp.]
YLCTAITDADGISYPMVDILKQTATMEGMKLHLGYREWNGFPGHEFHYSHIVEEAPSTSHSSLLTLHSTLYKYKNLRASYIHLYWGEKNLFELWND